MKQTIASFKTDGLIEIVSPRIFVTVGNAPNITVSFIA